MREASYTTVGPVRGGCGHSHGSLRTAVRCLHSDRVGCRRQGGYSDRRVVRVDGASMLAAEDLELEGELQRVLRG